MLLADRIKLSNCYFISCFIIGPDILSIAKYFLACHGHPVFGTFHIYSSFLGTLNLSFAIFNFKSKIGLNSFKRLEFIAYPIQYLFGLRIIRTETVILS